MKRLLNPQNLNIDLDSLPIQKIEGRDYRVYEEHISYIKKYTGCQCYKDCDCHLEHGKKVEHTNIWYRSTVYDGTNKCFYSKPKRKLIKSKIN